MKFSLNVLICWSMICTVKVYEGSNKVLLYKSYSNKLTHLKKISKRHYYNNLFIEHRDNKTEKWKIINNLISKNKKSSQQTIAETIAIKKKKYKTNTKEF